MFVSRFIHFSEQPYLYIFVFNWEDENFWHAQEYDVVFTFKTIRKHHYATFVKWSNDYNSVSVNMSRILFRLFPH